MRITFLVVCLVVAAALAVGSAGCAPAPQQATTVRIGIMGGLTGPAAAAVKANLEETELLFKQINEVEGGINGIKLEWKTIDNKGTPDGAIIAYKELRDSFKPVLNFVVEDYYYLGAKAQIEADKSVLLSLSALNNQGFVPPGRVFSMGIPTADAFGAYVKNVLTEMKGKAKIGVVYWDLPSGLQWRSAEAWARKQGADFAPVTYSMTTMDLKPQFLQIRDANVDRVWMMATTPQAALAIRDWRAVGLHGKIPFSFNEFTESEPLLKIAGEGAEGFFEYRAESPYSEKNQSSRLYTDLWAYGGKPDKWADNRLVITLKGIISTVVKQAAADVGKDKITSEAVFNALNKATRIDTYGTMENFGFGPDKRIGVSTIKVRQYTKNGTVAVGGWIPTPRIFEGVDK
jgi:ABC-type branched-subunit amino acid transport system substrate-binding protein